MYDMSSLINAKKEATVNQGKKSDEYEKSLKEGIDLYEQYNVDQNTTTIKKAADKFFKALVCKRTQMEPYLFLSMIFFLFDEEEMAREYFKTASELAVDRQDFAVLKEHMSKVIYGLAV